MRRERERPWPLPLPLLPAIQRRGHNFVDSASGRFCTFCQRPERTTRGRCPGASGTRARGAALKLRLGGSAGHRIVDLLQGGKEVSVLCAVWLLRWSCRPTVSAQQLPWCSDPW